MLPLFLIDGLGDSVKTLVVALQWSWAEQLGAFNIRPCLAVVLNPTVIIILITGLTKIIIKSQGLLDIIVEGECASREEQHYTGGSTEYGVNRVNLWVWISLPAKSNRIPAATYGGMLDPGLPNPAVLKCWWHVGYACVLISKKMDRARRILSTHFCRSNFDNFFWWPNNVKLSPRVRCCYYSDIILKYHHVVSLRYY